MAVFHFSADIIQRAKGHSVVAAAAYRAGERILEIRTGEVHDYRRRSGVDHREIMAPRGAPGWCKTRAELWNRAEDAERRKDAQVGRQVELALPRELSFKQRRRLVRRFVRKNFTCRGMVADIAYHDQAGENPHAHILLTMRRLGKENGFSRTKERAWNEKAQLESWRSSWALHVNAALRRAGCHSRVDHRTLEAQRLDALAAGDLGLAIKLDRAPGRHFGRAPVAIQARADGIAALTAAQDDEIRTGEVDQPDYEHPAYKAAEYERSWRMQEVLDERERETERRWEDQEGERANRNASRLFGLFAQPGGRDVYRAAVTEVITAWRPSVVDLPELPESPLVDRALDVAESSGGCLRRLRDLLEDAEGRSHYRGILDAHGEPISLEDVNRAIEEANRRIAAAADRRDRRRTILFGRPGGRDLYVAMLGEVESARGPTGKPSAATDDLVLDAVESEAARLIRLETLFQKPWGRGLYVANMRALGDRVTLPEIDAAVAAGEALARRAHCVVEGQALRAPLDVALLESEDTTVGDLESAVERAEERRFEERRAAEQEALRERARIEAERRSAEARRLAKEQQKRKDRLEWLESQAGGRDLYEKKLDGLDPSWRDRGEPNSERADAALTYAETELARIESERLAAEARRLAEEQQKRKDRLESIESQAGGRDLYEKKLAGLDPSWRDRGEPKVAVIDASLTHAETELKRRAEARQHAARRASRVDRVFGVRGGDVALILTLDRQRANWREAGVSARDVDRALNIAERNPDPTVWATEHALVLDGEQGFPRAGSREWWAGRDVFSRRTEPEERARALSSRLSDRSRVRESIGGGSEAQASSVVGRLVEWLRRQVQKLLRTLHLVDGAADSVMAKLPMAVPMYGQPEVPAVGDEPWKPAAEAGAVAMDVWVLVRERLDRGETAAGAPGCRREDRERAQKKYLEPLVAGELRRAERSWRERMDTARPTRESVVPVVLERHWSGIEELVRIESHRVLGESEKAAELERHRDQVCRSADSVMAKLPMAAPGYGQPGVPAVGDEPWKPAAKAGAVAMDVWVLVRERLDRGETAAGAPGCRREDRERAQKKYLEPLVAGELRRAERSWRGRRDTARPTRESVVPVVLERHWSGIEELVRIESHRVSGESEKAAELERHRDQVCRSADSVMAGLPMAAPMYGLPEVPAVGDEPWKPAAEAGAVAMDVWVLVRERLDRGESAGGAPGCRPADRELAQKVYLEPLVAGELRRAERSWRARMDTARPTRELVVPVVLERHWSGIEELVRIESHRVSGESEKAAELERHRDQVCRSADSVMAGLPMAAPMYGLPEVPAVGDEPWKPAAEAGAVAMDVWVLVRERLDRGESVGGAPGCRPADRELAQKVYLEPLVAGELRRAERSWRARMDTARPTRELVVPVVLERHWSGIEELVRIESHRVSGESEKAAELERHRDQVCRSADSVMAGLPMAAPMYGLPEVPAVGDELWKPAAEAGAVAMDVWVLVRERLDRGESAGGAPGCRPADRELAQKVYLEPLVAGELRRAERSWRARMDTARPTRELVVPVVLERHWSGIEELVRIESHRVSGESEKAAKLERHRDQVCRSADSVMAGLPMAAPMYGLPEVPAVEEEWREPVDASPLEAAVFVEVRNRLDREETAAGMERCSHEDRERAEQRYLDALVEEAVERQRQAYLASERTSPSQRREDIRAAVRREHRSRLGGILAAACRKSGRDGGSLDHPSDGTSARPASGEPAFAPGSVAASAEPGSLRGPDAGHARSGRPAREVGGASPQPADDERSTVPAPSRTEAKGDPCPRSDAGRGTRRARVATPVEQKALATRGKAPTTRIDVPSTASTTGPPSPDTKKGSTRAGKKGRGDIGWQR